MAQTSHPPPVRIPAKLAGDVETRQFFFELTKAVYLMWEKMRNLEQTAALATITHTAPGTPDYAIQNLVNPGFGFVTLDEGNSVLQVIANLQTRMSEIEKHFING